MGEVGKYCVASQGEGAMATIEIVGIKKGSHAPQNDRQTEQSERPATGVEHHQCNRNNHCTDIQFAPFT